MMYENHQRWKYTICCRRMVRMSRIMIHTCVFFYNEDGAPVYSEKEARYNEYDAVVILTNHRIFNKTEIVTNANLIIDTRNMFKGEDSEKVYRIGAGLPERVTMMQ